MPASAQECAASATSDADPVTAAATDLATAISRLAPNATITVSRLSEPGRTPVGRVEQVGVRHGTRAGHAAKRIGARACSGPARMRRSTPEIAATAQKTGWKPHAQAERKRHHPAVVRADRQQQVAVRVVVGEPGADHQRVGAGPGPHPNVDVPAR